MMKRQLNIFVVTLKYLVSEKVWFKNRQMLKMEVLVIPQLSLQVTLRNYTKFVIHSLEDLIQQCPSHLQIYLLQSYEPCGPWVINYLFMLLCWTSSHSICITLLRTTDISSQFGVFQANKYIFLFPCTMCAIQINYEQVHSDT